MRDVATLIVSASAGSGHVQAGEALREAFAASPSGDPVEHVDLLDLAPRWVRAAYGRGYELISSRTPWLWREIYHLTDAASADRARWGPLAHRILFREFRRLLLSRRWRVCVCTHFLPGQLAAGTPGAPPFAMVITDLTLHHFWAQPRVRRYFVPNETLGSALRPRVGPARVAATGIPTSMRFAAAPSQAEARRALGLDPSRPVVLTMGGGAGLGVEEAAHAALVASDDVQLVAVCGRNGAAEARLRQLATRDERLHVYGFVPDVERYMAAADLVVSKPGGLTTSEVLAVGRPLLLTHAIPGQEEGNAEVLCHAGAALRARDTRELTDQIARVLGDPAQLRALSATATALGRPRAAQDIVQLVNEDERMESAA